MLDANANRAREALRMLEDAARFAVNDGDLSGALKSLRHDLRSALNALPAGWLEAHRDTPGDVGTAISTETEKSRASLADAVIAAGKRLTEALRVIEESGKVIDPSFAAAIESLRYRAYDLDQRLMLRLGTGRARQWRLCLLLTQSMCTTPWREVLSQAIDGGADCVQVREKDMSGGDLASHAREVIDIARPRRVRVIINDRADIALACGADGVHLGQNDVGVPDVRRIAGRTLLVGVSTHDISEAERAVGNGADYCGVGAMFSSSTKQRDVSGLAYLREFVRRFPDTPHLAIGGITPANIDQVIAAGAKGVAVSAAICEAREVSATTRALVAAMESPLRRADDTLRPSVVESR